MPGSKGLTPHVLAHKWMKDLVLRPDMEQNIQWMFVLHRSKRILERIVEVRRTEQSVGSILYYFYTKT